MKILGIAPIPTEELFKLRSECEALHNHIDELLHLSYVETPAEETTKEEASAEPKQEASSNDELNGLVVHNYAQKKPFEMVIE